MFNVRRLRPDDWRAYRDLRLRALHDSPSAFGSTFEVEQAKPDVYWEARVASAALATNQLPLVAEEDSDPVGLVWGWIDLERPLEAHVIQMWVTPEMRGRGCGAELLDSVIRWARESTAQSMYLRVTCGDTSATRLYLRAGFQLDGTPEPLRPGSPELAQPMKLDL